MIVISRPLAGSLPYVSARKPAIIQVAFVLYAI